MSAQADLRLLHAAYAHGKPWTRLIRSAGGIRALRCMDARALARLGLGAADVRHLRCNTDPLPAEWLTWIGRPGHRVICLGSSGYPQRLAEIPDPPIAIWVDGEAISLLEAPQLAIVGSRHPTRSGVVTAESLAAHVSEYGITVTSGLALGVDSASHRGALSGPGQTVAVLGSGIDRIYPGANRALAAEIRQQGLIVSEYPPATPARAGHFPRRNRIIAGLSLGTLVIEATRRSGSLITARQAVDFGREVFAIPGSIHNALSKGCHKLIRQGAKLVESVDDILEEIAPQLRAVAHVESTASAEDLPAILADCLDFSPISLDVLISATGLTAAELSSMLLHLEIQGKIEALPGGRYCRLAKRA